MKAILELEMPKSCSECVYHRDIIEMNSFRCTALKQKLKCNKFYFKRHPQCPLQPKATNEEVEEALFHFREFERLLREIENPYIMEDIETEEQATQITDNIINLLLSRFKDLEDSIKQPKSTNDEVEEIINRIQKRTKDMTDGYIEGYLKKRVLNNWYDTLKLKTKFQQMQQEIQDLRIHNYQKKNLINKYHNIDFPDLRKQIENLEGNNQQYIQLLDKIEIKEIDNPKCTLVNGVMVGESLVNIIKELKSIGGNK